MIKSWLSSLMPSLLIGLLVGGVATWQLESAIERQFERAAFASEVERQRLISDISIASADKLEAVLQDLHTNEVQVERHFTTEIIKPVFTNVCASDDYVRMFNESAAAAERTLSGKHDAGVSGKPPPLKG